MTTVLHFINGEEVASLSGRKFESSSPGTGEKIADIAFGEREDVDRAVDVAWTAFERGQWSETRPAFRASCLRRIANIVRERAEEIARLETLDSGKPIKDARGSVESSAVALEYASSLPENIRGHVFAREAGQFSYSQREPYGVVGAIAPWNYPFQLAVQKTAAALACGNSVVLKMAEQTPLTTSLYAQLCTEAGLPAGVLNVVHGDGATTGAALAEHPRVPKMTFTGSTEVGQRILAVGARWIKSCDVELGGKAPNIVFPDADLEQAITGSLFTSFLNSGQICTSGSRLLVHESVADEFVEQLVVRARRLVVGDPLDDSTRLGPLVSRTQLERVKGYVTVGCEAGAAVVTGGGPPDLSEPFDGGYFFEPTIFVDVDPAMKIAQEEIFGPVLSVIKFRDDDEAIRIANDVTYGLAATIWTNQLDRALNLARRLQAGIIWTNCPHGSAPHTPAEGHKHSGIGEVGGLEAIGTFTKLKVNHINTTGLPIAWP
jgi:acyl-CoA reductase-like NAD-dependent aldehyde dehydrogenase